MVLDTWKRIVLDPCNRTAQRRNEAAIRDSFEEIVNYITNITTTTTIEGDGSVVFFEVTTTSIGSASTAAKEIVTPGFTATGRDFTIYDYSANKRFAQNFVDGFVGCGRLSPDIAEDAVVVIELEGYARWISGTLNADVVGGTVQATVDAYWGAFPNSADPGSPVTVVDRINCAYNAKEGDGYLAVWDEQEQEYVIVKVADEEVIFFEVKAEQELGVQSCEVTEITIDTSGPSPVFNADGRTFTAYDYTGNGRFGQNFVEGYRGVGRWAPEIADDALVIIELEGKARWIDGTLNANLTGSSVACTVTRYWGAYPNIHDPGSPVTVYDRIGLASGALSGDKYLAVWDEQEQQYIFVLPVVCNCVASGEMEFVKLCAEEANVCCLWDAIIWRVKDTTESFCAPEICIKSIWLYCYQGVKAGDIFPLGTGADEDLADEGTTSHWCGMAKLVKQNHACALGTRDVYAVDCGDCTCECPEEVAYVVIPGNDCFSEISFGVSCVLADPITGTTPSLGQTYYWGEFSVTGYYPLVGQILSVDEFSFNGENHTEVIVVIGCNGTQDPADLTALCRATKTYVLMSDGTFVEYTGTFTHDPAGTPVWSGEIFITDADGCQLFCQRTYNYGMLLMCSGASFTGNVIYHLWPEGSITRSEDACSEVEVPGTGQYFHDGDSITRVTQAACCVPKTEMKFDSLFGYSYSCNIDITKDATGLGLTKSDDPMKYHVFAGCIDQLAHAYGGAPTSMPICDPNVVASGDVNFFVYWGAIKVTVCEE